MRLSFFTIIVILLSSLCYAESSNKKYTFVGYGVVKCYEFIDKSKDYYLRDLLFHSWALGFMTAKNTYAGVDVDLTIEINGFVKAFMVLKPLTNGVHIALYIGRNGTAIAGPQCIGKRSKLIPPSFFPKSTTFQQAIGIVWV